MRARAGAKVNRGSRTGVAGRGRATPREGGGRATPREGRGRGSVSKILKEAYDQGSCYQKSKSSPLSYLI